MSFSPANAKPGGVIAQYNACLADLNAVDTQRQTTDHNPMPNNSDFVSHVRELLAPAGHVVIKRMFGGHGVYLDGWFMAIIAGDELYLKADEISRAAFDAEACAPFVYTKDGKDMTMNYRRAPDEALDAPHLMLPWARRALEAALRARAAKPIAKKTPAEKPAKKKAAKKKSSRPAAQKRRK